jgi:(R)-2-hydroxyacyl-CoA dehydratese activating ATPase
MVVAGLDIGSVFSRAVIMEENIVVSTTIRPTGGDFRKAVNDLLRDVLPSDQFDLTDIDSLGACGMGATFIDRPFLKIAELPCLSRGVHFILPDIRSIIEVGNQYSRVVRINDDGKVTDNMVSEKCAAGSGRILQVIANVLGVGMDELGPLSAQADRPAKFTTNCAVFLETEAISRVAEGIPAADIIGGLHHTLTAKIARMVKRMKITGDCAMTGGGALDSGLTQAIETELGLRLHVPRQFMMASAIGAALIAAERASRVPTIKTCNPSPEPKAYSMYASGASTLPGPLN